MGFSWPHIQAVVTERHRMGECPVWDEAAGQLLYLDIFEQIRTCVAGNRRACVCRRPGDHVGSCMVAAGTRVGLLDWDLQDMQWIVQLEGDKPGIRVNYGPCGAVCDK